MKRALLSLLALGVLAVSAGLWITRPQTVDPDAMGLADVEADAARGESVYWASGCASCHIAPESEDKLVLAGGQRFATAFGDFVAPNISPDPEVGIGGWTLAEFASALIHGTSPDGQHYYPVFPYASYARMTSQDVADLWAFMLTLPPSDQPSAPHEVGFPFNIRLSLGGWKFLFANSDWVQPAETAQMERGRYLVEALAHCGECHTPRNALGALDTAQWMAGAANPSGDGRIPGLRRGQLTWSETDIAYYLETGFTPDFDSAGGEMVSVIENMAQLSPDDRAAIAAYIVALGE